MSKQAYVLAVDIGTTSVKVLAINEQLKVVHRVSKKNETTISEGGKSEQLAAMLWQNVKDGIREVVAEMGQADAIAFSSAMHAIMGVELDGTPLTPFILWSDTRAIPQTKALKAITFGHEVYQIGGTPIHPMAPLLKLKWLKENESVLFEKVEKWVGIKSFILYQLIGAWVCDYSMASGTAMMDVKGKEWNRAVLAYLDINESLLPELVDTDHKLAKIHNSVASELGLNADTPIIVGGADGPLANLGAEVDDTKTPVLTIGTSGAMRLRIPDFRTDIGQQLFCYYLNRDSYVIGGATNNGGNVFEWLKSLFGDIDFEEALEKTTIGADGLLFVPYINGERAPFWDADCEGSFEGIRSFHRKEHFVRAALEGVMLNVWMIGEQLERLSSITFDKIYVSGGFLQLTAWAQIFADISGKSLIKGDSQDASAIGAAKICWKAIGKGGLEKEISEVFLEASSLNHLKYQDIYKKFKVIVTSKFDKQK